MRFKIQFLSHISYISNAQLLYIATSFCMTVQIFRIVSSLQKFPPGSSGLEEQIKEFNFFLWEKKRDLGKLFLFFNFNFIVRLLLKIMYLLVFSRTFNVFQKPSRLMLDLGHFSVQDQKKKGDLKVLRGKFAPTLSREEQDWKDCHHGHWSSHENHQLQNEWEKSQSCKKPSRSNNIRT